MAPDRKDARPGTIRRGRVLSRVAFVAALAMSNACRRDTAHAAPPAALPKTVATPTKAAAPFATEKVDFTAPAMGTEVHFVAFTTPKLDAPSIRAAMERAHAEIKRIEGIMTSWRDDSEVGQINLHAGQPVKVSDETIDVIEKSKWSGDISSGVFDITFHALGDLWKFGDAAEANPKLPDPAVVARQRKYVDYRKVVVDRAAHTVKIEKGMSIDLGGIAKGYSVDRAAAVLKAAGLTSFLAQAGGDLFGAGRKPDGAPWVSGIQDPRQPPGAFFATIELTDHAFSTAGDYARSFILGGRRYHHIIDPRTGYPATASRSVTIWAPDAFTADAIDDAVFILGPKRGLALIESLPGTGAVIVDAHNKVWVSQRLVGKVHVLHPPTDGI